MELNEMIEESIDRIDKARYLAKHVQPGTIARLVFADSVTNRMRDVRIMTKMSDYDHLHFYVLDAVGDEKKEDNYRWCYLSSIYQFDIIKPGDGNAPYETFSEFPQEIQIEKTITKTVWDESALSIGKAYSILMDHMAEKMIDVIYAGKDTNDNLMFVCLSDQSCTHTIYIGPPGTQQGFKVFELNLT